MAAKSQTTVVDSDVETCCIETFHINLPAVDVDRSVPQHCGPDFGFVHINGLDDIGVYRPQCSMD